jgi:hypothetical protein
MRRLRLRPRQRLKSTLSFIDPSHGFVVQRMQPRAAGKVDDHAVRPWSRRKPPKRGALLTRCLPGQISQIAKIQEMPGFTGAPDTIRTFAFGGQTPTALVPEQRIRTNRENGVLQAPRQPRHGVLPYPAQCCLMVLLSMRGNWRDRLLSTAQFHFSAVAQTVGLVYEKSKMLYFSMGID